MKMAAGDAHRAGTFAAGESPSGRRRPLADRMSPHQDRKNNAHTPEFCWTWLGLANRWTFYWCIRVRAREQNEIRKPKSRRIRP
jgi:hypothetical protein